MKMEVLAVQQQYQSKYNIYGSSKVRGKLKILENTRKFQFEIFEK